MKFYKIKEFFKKNFIRGTKGAISLFLAILLGPFSAISISLINAGRINSAVAIFDEALCNASNSTLGTYDSFIRERFALMAISQDITKGAQKFGKSGTGYTSDQFINDLFTYYMKTNLKALSNTYNEETIGATGLYPLADTDVLKTSVLQASKIIVPAKLVVDWGSIDDLLANLTKPFDMLTSLTKTIGSGAEAVTAASKLTEAQTALNTAIDNCNTAKTDYETAHTNYVNAISDYNGTIDSIVYWNGEKNRLQGVFNELEKAAASVTAQITSTQKEIEKLQKDKNKDHTEEIATLTAKITELEEEREKVAPGYADTKEQLETAKRNYELYKNALPGKRSTARSQKSNYYNKIIALRDSINTLSGAAKDFKDACTSLQTKSAEVITNAVTTGFEAAENSIEKNKKELEAENEYYKYQQTLAEYDNKTEYATHYYNMTQENNTAINNLENNKINNANVNQVVTSAKNAGNEVVKSLSEFDKKEVESKCATIYQELDKLANNVNGVSIPETQNKITNYNYYYKFSLPITKDEVNGIIDGLDAEIAKSGGWKVLTLVLDFFKELIRLELWYDSDLTSTVKNGNYASIGGLPSKRASSSYMSIYDKEDARQAESNKAMLNSYSDVEVYEVEGGGLSTLELLEGYIDTIKEKTNPFKLKHIPDLWTAINGVISCITNLAGSLIVSGIKSAAKGIGNRFLIVGYISYNTANRTTYKGSGLTGCGYGLPRIEQNTEGYLFSGAETEYIFKGSMSEKDNQKATFNAIWIERMLFDIAGVMADATVQTLATTIGAVTFGIGTVLTYVIFIALEGLVDAIILVNGGDIPLFKTFIYLSPGGVVKLAEKILMLTLSEATQQSLYEKTQSCASGLNEGVKNSALEHGKYIGEQTVPDTTYNEYKQQQKADGDKTANKIKSIFDLDYTKSLQIIMLLFGNTDKMLKRLADIIQMESTYKAKSGAATYTFDLGKSYTYIRAHGSFTSDVFKKIGDESSLTSTNRVIYNGY